MLSGRAFHSFVAHVKNACFPRSVALSPHGEKASVQSPDGTFLCGVCTFPSCMCRFFFSPGTPASSHSPETCSISLYRFACEYRCVWTVQGVARLCPAVTG